MKWGSKLHLEKQGGFNISKMIYVEDIETTGIGNHLFLGVRKGLDSKGLGHIAP